MFDEACALIRKSGLSRVAAAYFLEDGGTRTAIIVIDVKDPSHIPAVAEPWFLAFDAKVEFHPAMNAEDLKKAGAAIKNAVERFG